jgi:putative endopeptidase
MKMLFVKTWMIVAIILICNEASFAQSTKKFIDQSNMDLSIKPGDDFYRFANGNWVKNNPVPAKETRWGSFNELRDFNSNAVKTILEKASKNKTARPGTVEKRVGDFYAAGMDTATIEKLGFTPVKADLAKIDAIKNSEEVLKAIIWLRTQGIGSPLFGFYVGQDRKNVEHMIPQLSQGGTSLPDRDYYLKEDKRSKEIREAYSKYIVELFRLTGSKDAEAQHSALAIFNIEKQLAKAQLARVEMRDAYRTYNKFAVADFNKNTPGMDWKTILTGLKVKNEDTLLVNNPAFFITADSLLKTVSVNDWKVYLKWNILKSAASYLSSPFVKANFAFEQALTGQKVQKPRWQRISALTDGNIGELLGQLYVKEYFKPEAKARMQELVSNLRKAYAIRIQKLDWMSAATKQKALAKLAAFRPKIAYPDKWLNYDGLVIDRNNFFKNTRNVDLWQYNYMISRLGKPVDRERWGMTPPTVNAYYSATLNEIVFPAGILQFPFFDPHADDAINYGGIGTVIGHEMSHGFDDNGSKYDADGTLRNWWTDEDRKNFDAKTQVLIKQYDAYTVLDTLHVNGKLTIGENIGDLGGLNVAYEAFKMTKQGQSDKKIDGFTPDQRFFLSFAQVWRGNILPEFAAQSILTDTHSPGQYRAIGAPVNMDAWYKAFNVQPGEKLYKKPEDRIRIW